MKKYRVTGAIPVYLNVAVEVEEQEDEDETKAAAIEKAFNYMLLEGFCGNGGHGKLIGTRETNVTIEAGCEVLEGKSDFKIDVEEADR